MNEKEKRNKRWMKKTRWTSREENKVNDNSPWNKIDEYIGMIFVCLTLEH